MLSSKELEEVLPAIMLQQLAVQHGVDRSKTMRLPAPTMLLCLLDALLNHEAATLRLLEEIYTVQTGGTADHSTFGKVLVRLPAGYFADVAREVHARVAPLAKPRDLGGLTLRILDATNVALSAKLLHFGIHNPGWRKGEKTAGGRVVKSVFELDSEGTPGLLHLCRDQSEASDSLALGKPMAEATRPGDLWLFDGGCHGRERLLDIADAGGFWITPHHQQAFEVRQVLQETTVPEPLSPPGEGDEGYRLVRVEEALFQNSKPSALNEALREMPILVLHGLRWDRRSRKWVPLVLMTNLPLSGSLREAGPFSFWEVAALYRRRWEIELFFRLLKQHLGYAHMTSRQENGIRVMVYVALIAALLMIWYRRVTAIDRGWRSVRFWLAHDIHEWTRQALQTCIPSPLAAGP